MNAKHNPYAALRHADFRLLLFGRFVGALAQLMTTVAIGWELYDRTNSTFALGLVGLVQVIPVIVFSLYGGHIADRLNRKRVVIVTMMGVSLCGAALTVLSATHGPLASIYLILFCMGLARAFGDPASGSLLPQTCPPEDFENAVTWSSSSWQLASVVGPALGGAVIALTHSATFVYAVHTVSALIFAVCVAGIRGRQTHVVKEQSALESLREGLVFMRRTPIILAAITLDMFAVLLGGATALLPVYAKDILNAGPEGLGLLRAAPSIGALAMTLVLAHLPPMQQAGKTLLIAVIGFGVATVIFGVSTSFVLSLAMLAVLGALDNISVVIRSSLLLLRTPDAMRGRVQAINSIFISTSNEMGEFESGFAAALVGPVAAVVGGGIGTIIVVLLVGWLSPEMRTLRRLRPDTPATPSLAQIDG